MFELRAAPVREQAHASRGSVGLTNVQPVLKAADRGLLRLLRTRGHARRAELAVLRFSKLGEHSAIWFAVAGLGALCDRRRAPAYRRAIRVVAAAEIGNALIKLAIRRPRPVLEGLPPIASTMSNRSCPSAHATCSFAAATALSGALPPAPLYAVAVAMGLSRAYLGVHYPSDVLAGMALGTLTAKVIP
jgi:decaprenylphosphoryl-5-phosphoribose phosphatase